MHPNTQQQVVTGTPSCTVLMHRVFVRRTTLTPYGRWQESPSLGLRSALGWVWIMSKLLSVVLDEKLQQAIVYNFAIPGFALDQMWLSPRHY